MVVCIILRQNALNCIMTIHNIITKYHDFSAFSGTKYVSVFNACFPILNMFINAALYFNMKSMFYLTLTEVFCKNYVIFSVTKRTNKEVSYTTKVKIYFNLPTEGHSKEFE